MRIRSCLVRAVLGVCALCVAPVPAMHVQASECPAGALPGKKQVSPPVTTLVPNRVNLVGVPPFSPVNDPATGFPQLCMLFNLPPSAELSQTDPETGEWHSYTCGSEVPPLFRPCHAVSIRTSVEASAVIPMGGRGGGTRGVDGAWDYTLYGDGSGAMGKHLFRVPFTIESTDMRDLCFDLGVLGLGTLIVKYDAAAGHFQNFFCDQVVPPAPLTPGEVLYIRGGGPAGQPISSGIVVIH